MNRELTDAEVKALTELSYKKSIKKGNKMSKELEALERIINAFECGLPIHTKDVKTLKKALKEKEQQDDVLKIIKEIIAFSQMLPYIEPNKDNGFDVMSAVQINIRRDIENKERELLRKWVLETCFPKEFKALEIIKEHRLDVDLFLTIMEDKNQNDKLWSYNFWNKENPLTKEEFNLIKEALL